MVSAVAVGRAGTGAGTGAGTALTLNAAYTMSFAWQRPRCIDGAARWIPAAAAAGLRLATEAETGVTGYPGEEASLDRAWAKSAAYR